MDAFKLLPWNLNERVNLCRDAVKSGMIPVGTIIVILESIQTDIAAALTALRAGEVKSEDPIPTDNRAA